MAKYEHLPIYRKTFELSVYLERVIGGFSKMHKYGLGLRILDSSQLVISRVVRAQNSEVPERISELKELRIEVEVLKNQLHLAMEVGAFKSFNAYNHAAGLAVEVSKQTEGWLKSYSVTRAPESRPTNSLEGRS